jgi:putative spermidine/putrescine transport system ATP-binding protein
LSGGQQQRVALARAIVFDPNALLLDEPLGALDRNLRGTLQAEIHRIHREVGTTFVFVTHDQEEAMNLSDRIALFNNGRIEQIGTPEALYQTPDSLFAARFLGDSNVFELSGAPGDTVAWEDTIWSVDSRTVSARAAGAGVSGHVALVVRPEDVRISPTEHPTPPGVNTVSATIRDIEYMGAYRTAVLSIGHGGVLGRARLDAMEAGLTAGQQVVAWWPVDRQRLVTA